ncbi:hypothetical protein NIES2104_15140 [Leptolyngbya sp. NIES-2104]|nr:hypothetical protein NIES2104_15140 [Leptolyngbya sp. NIES-2104]
MGIACVMAANLKHQEFLLYQGICSNDLLNRLNLDFKM